MLTREQAKDLVASTLAFDYRAHTPCDLILGEFERDWGWLFLYPCWVAGKQAGWIVNRHTSEMRDMPEFSSPEEAMADYERGLTS
jgi:hypothetical protein